MDVQATPGPLRPSRASVPRSRCASWLLGAALATAPLAGAAHSNVAGFSGLANQGPHDHAEADAPQGPRHPGWVVVDPRRVQSVVVKINARVVNIRPLYAGKPVKRGEVLAELESPELLTAQKTYLGIFNNLRAVKAASLTAPQKLVDGRMALEWRGMGASDIEILEATRQPLQRIPVRAPASGYLYGLSMVSEQILNAGVQNGQFTAAGTAIASIAPRDALLVEATVPVAAASLLRPGMNATVFLPDPARGWVPVKAKVQAISGLSNGGSQRQVVRIGLLEAAPRPAFANGLAVTVAFEEERDVKARPQAH